MSATLMVAARAFSPTITAGTPQYMYVGGRISPETIEARVERTIKSAGAFSNLYMRVIANGTGDKTLITRKNGAGGNQTVTCADSSSGEFEDTVNTDTISVGDEFNYQITNSAGATTITFGNISILFAATTNTVTLALSRGSSFSTASSTYYIALEGGDLWNSDEFQAQTDQIGSTLRNLATYIVSNARTTTTTFKSRKNATDGNMSIAVTATSTGYFEDTSNTDSITSGDGVNLSITTLTGAGSIAPNWVGTEMESSLRESFNQASITPAVTIAVGVTRSFPLGGFLEAITTESEAQTEANTVTTYGFISTHIATNTISENSILRFRKNGADGNQVTTITASTTGFFSDPSGTDSVISGDNINYLITTGGVGTSLTINNIITFATATDVSHGGPSQTFFRVRLRRY